MILTGGINVHPFRSGAGHLRTTGGAGSLSLGVTEGKWSKAIKAVGILKERAALTQEELVNRYCRLWGGVKRPRSIGFVTELPKRPNAKITKRPLRLIYSATP
jgi:long-chain acyl-CoA synthetase